MNKNICVVGAGYWGKNHIKTLHYLNALKGVVELNIATLSALDKRYPGIQLHNSIKDALLYDYDGYIIATPAKTHFEIAKLIIESKKHVLIEKPMTLSIQEARQLVSLAEKNQISGWLGMCFYFILR